MEGTNEEKLDGEVDEFSNHRLYSSRQKTKDYYV